MVCLLKAGSDAVRIFVDIIERSAVAVADNETFGVPLVIWM